MASPFSYFRRHQRKLMALLTLAAMFTFVCMGFLGFGSQQLLDVLGVRRQQVRNPVVVRTNWTTLTASDLRGQGGLMARRALANRFVTEVQRKTIQFPAFPGFGAASEMEVVNAEVLRHKARQMGITVNDEAVDKFLLAITGERLTQQGFVDARKEMKVSEEQIYSVLRDELLAYNASQLLAGEAPTFTPEELREYYHKLRDRAEVQAVGVPAEAFLDQTETPSEQQLREYFERYREFFSYPFSPMPGFRQQRRVQVEYVRADFDKTVAAMTVSDDDITAYYEENKQSKYRMTEESELTKESDAEAGGAKPDEQAPQQPAESPDAAQPGEGEKDSAENTPSTSEADPDASADGTAASKATEPVEPGQTAPSDQADETRTGQPDAPAGQQNTPDATSDKSDQEQAKSPDTPSKDEGADSNPKDDDANTKPQDESTEKKPQDESTETKPQDENKEPPSKTQEEESIGRPKSEPRYRELDDELRQIIRQELQRTRARELIDELLAEFQYEVFDGYSEQYALWDADRLDRLAEEEGSEKKARETPPPPPPAPEPLEFLGQSVTGITPTELLQHALAVVRAHERFQKVALQYGNSGLVNSYELSDLKELADARECARGEPVRQDARPLVAIVFETPGRYVSALACKLDEEEETGSFSIREPEKSDTYLFWKTDDRPEFTPKDLSEVRDQVERAWRLDRARVLARRRAQELAEMARTQGTDLTESLAGQKVNPEAQDVVTVLQPPAFSWLSRPQEQMFAAPGITDVAGLEHVGDDFMRVVFGLSEGQVGMVPNAPETTYYVVRVKVLNVAPRNGLLSESFFGFFSEYQQLAQQHAQAKLTQVVRRLYREADLKWEDRDMQ